MNHDDFHFELPCRPNPLVIFSRIWVDGQYLTPRFGDRHSLIILKRKLPKKVTFDRAYAGWRASGAIEEKELGEGRAFLRWLQKHQLAIEWRSKDFRPHPYFSISDSPKHDPHDELAQGLSFAIKPVSILNRKIKLYIQDDDMIGLLNMSYGNEEDFLELVVKYITQRFEWEKWRAPAPTFLDWIISHGMRPIFRPGQLGLNLGIFNLADG